ncbi:MAG: ABC transporter substrate-binding protein [Janthinobacterium lividum]
MMKQPWLSYFKKGIFALSMITNSWAIESQKVLISQTVDHPALSATTQGIIDALSEAGFKQGQSFDIRVESAQANAALAHQIAQKFIHQNPDIVVGIGTLSAQSFAKAALQGNVKLIFSSVTDPLGAGLVTSLTKLERNTSGVSNFVDLEPQLTLFQKIQPTLKRLGFLYNPGEANSVYILKKLQHLCAQLNIDVVPQGAMKTADVPQGATKLAQNVDAIFISNDNTALSSLPSVIKIATLAKIPVYVSDTDAVAQGALAALGPNQYDVGVRTGKMIARILQGKDIAEQGVEFPQKVDLYLNADTAAQLGLKIPDDVMTSATKIISEKRSSL